MALRVGVKRSREAHVSKTRLGHHPNQDDPCAMMVDDDDDSATTLMLDDAGFDADKDDDDDAVDTYYSSSDANGDQPRRKRAMLVKANIQFLQKLPPLRNYQRGQFGRRGAVDGGTPDSDMGMNALEETMGESSFAVSSRPPTVSRAAIVAPAPVMSSFQRCQQQHQQQYQPRQQQPTGQAGSSAMDRSSSNQGYGNEQQRNQRESHGGGGGGKNHGRGKREPRDSQDSSNHNHPRGINRNLIGTKPCIFWASGKCTKGDQCTFRHD